MVSILWVGITSQAFAEPDTTPPTLTAPADVTLETPENTSPTNTGIPTVSDDIDPNPIIIFFDVVAPGGCAGNFTITRTWTAIDEAGNQAAAVQIITSQDTTPPTLTAPPDTSVNLGDSSDPPATGIATASDAGSGPPSIVWADTTNGNVITRTWTATDDCGNSTSANQTIVIIVTISIGLDPVVQFEGDVGSTGFTFDLTRTGATTGTASVNWAVTSSGGSPANGADFFGGTLPSGTANFGAGESETQVTVNVQGDQMVEPDEGFTVILSNPPPAHVLGNSTETGTIQNDDSATVTPIPTLQAWALVLLGGMLGLIGVRRGMK
jgi:hypothetical protein